MKTFPVYWLNAPAWLPLIQALLHTLWLGALAAGGLFLALRLVPAQRASLRYGLSAGALALLLVLGIGAWALLDQPSDASTANASPRAPQLAAMPALRVGAAPVTLALQPTVASPEGANPPSVGGKSSASAPPIAPPNSPVKPWVRWAAACWLLGVMICLARAARGAVGAGRLRRHCQTLTDPRVLALADELRARLRLRRRVRLLVCERIGVPAVMGVFWPAVLLPAAMLAGGVPTEQLRAILAHELAHIRRWDYLVNLGQMLAEAILFFNPFVWWISRQMRLEREACCDQLAAGQCESPARYVEALVAVIEQRRHAAVEAPLLAASGSAHDRGGNALDRARRLLVPGYQPALRLRWFSLAAVLAISALALSGLWTGARAVAQTIQKPEQKAKATDAPPTKDPNVEYIDVHGAGKVSMADGSPLGKHEITVYNYAERHPGGASGGGAHVAPDGSFSFYYADDTVAITLAADQEGCATTFVGPIAPSSLDKQKGVEIKLTRGYSAAMEVVDEAGKPIAGALLIGYYPGPPEVDFSEVKTDASGIGAFEHVGVSPLNVRVRAVGYASDEIANAHLDPVKPLRWTLKKAQALPGIVTAAATGRPIAGAVIKLGGVRVAEHDVRGPRDENHYDPRKAPVLTTADAQGRFALGSLRADSRYYLFVEAPGYGGAYLCEVALAQGELKVALGPELFVRGKIIHAPASVIHMEEENNLYLQYSQTFRVGENYAGSSAESITLHPKDGKAEFSVGPFYKVYGELPDPHGMMSSSKKAVSLYVDTWGQANFDADSLPISDFVFDLEKPSSRSHQAEAETPKPAPAVSPAAYASPTPAPAPSPKAESAKADAQSARPTGPPRMLNFHGKVSTADGAPIDPDSAWIHLHQTTGLYENGSMGGNERIEADGSARIGIMADARTATCVAVMKGYAPAFAAPFSVARKDLAEVIPFTLTRGFNATIQTVDEAGQPIAGAQFSAYYPGPPEIEGGDFRSDASGAATLEHVGQAPLNVRVRAEGFQAEEIKGIRLDPAKPYRWTLKKAQPLPGVVTAAASGRPIAGAKIKLAAVRGAGEHETHYDPKTAPLLTESDAQGRFTLTTLCADCTYYFFVDAPNYGGAFVSSFTLAKGTLAVPLGQPLIVHGKILHAPPSVTHMGKVYLNYGQAFRFGDGSGQKGEALELYVKDGEASFTVGSFYEPQGETPPAPDDWTAQKLPIVLYVDAWAHARFAPSDLPKTDFVFDLAKDSPLREQPAAGGTKPASDSGGAKPSPAPDAAPVASPAANAAAPLAAGSPPPENAAEEEEPKVDPDFFMLGKSDHYLGKLSTEDGAPLGDKAKITQLAVAQGGQGGRWELPDQAVNADGSFLIMVPRSTARYTIAAAREGYATEFAGPFDPARKKLEGLQIKLAKGFNAALQTVDETGQPIPYAHLEAYYPGPPKVDFADAITDAAGGFLFEHVGASPLNVRVRAEGYQADEIVIIPLDPAKPYRWTLKKAPPLLGSVVSYATRRPIPGATVKLVGELSAHNVVYPKLDQAPVLSTTDVNGRFMLSTLRPENFYFLLVEAPGFGKLLLRAVNSRQGDLKVSLGSPVIVRGKAIHVDPAFCRPDGTFNLGIEQTIPITSEEGAYYQQNLTLTPKNGEAEFVSEALYPGDVSLHAYGVGFKQVELSENELPKTDFILDLASATPDLSEESPTPAAASSPPLQPSLVSTPSPSPAAAAPSPKAQAQPAAADEQFKRLDLAEQYPGSLSLEDGVPLDGKAKAFVNASSAQETSFDLPINVDQSDGTFFTLVPPTAARLTVAAAREGYATTFVGPFAPPSKEKLTGLKVILPHGFLASVQTVNEAGQPIAGAKLEAYYPGPPKIGFARKTTDAAGTAAFEHVGAAALNVRVRAEGYQADEIVGIALDPAKPYRWTLKKTPPLPGVVVSASDGQPIEGAKVKLLGEFGPRETIYSIAAVAQMVDPILEEAPLLTVSDAQGRFALTSLRPDSRYFLLVDAPGFGKAFLPAVQSGQGELKIALGPELRVRGKITHIDPAFAPGGKLSLNYMQTVEVGGKFFGALAQPSLELAVKNGEAEVDVDALYPCDINFYVERGGQVKSFLIEAKDLPKTGFVFDLAKTPFNQATPPAPVAPAEGVSTPAPGAQASPASAGRQIADAKKAN